MGENQADEITAPVALLIKSMSYNLVFTTNLKLYLTFVALITFTGESERNDTEKKWLWIWTLGEFKAEQLAGASDSYKTAILITAIGVAVLRGEKLPSE